MHNAVGAIFCFHNKLIFVIERRAVTNMKQKCHYKYQSRFKTHQNGNPKRGWYAEFCKPPKEHVLDGKDDAKQEAEASYHHVGDAQEIILTTCAWIASTKTAMKLALIAKHMTGNKQQCKNLLRFPA